MPATIDETPKKNELPRNLARRLSQEKLDAAMDLAKDDPELAGALMLAADTVVSVGRRILPKAELIEEAACLPPPALRPLAPRLHRPRLRQRQGPHPPPPGRDARPLQAPVARGYRILSRLRRMARQGRRLCRPGFRRRFRRQDQRLVFQRRRPAALRSDDAADRGGLPGPIQLAEPGLVRHGSRRSGQGRAAPSVGSVPDLRQAATVRAFYPFCSKRCTDIDLTHWLSGSYAIPAVESRDGQRGRRGERWRRAEARKITFASTRSGRSPGF